MELNHDQQYVTFTLHGELFGVEVRHAREILDLAPITKIPLTPDAMVGVINLRGQAVPVVDLQRRLGLAGGRDHRQNCIIVVEIQLDGELLSVGILVDEVCEVLELGREAIEPPPRLGTKLNTQFIRGMGKLKEKFLILLAIDRVFADAELVTFQNSIDCHAEQGIEQANG